MPGRGYKVGEVYYEVTADNQVERGMAAAEGSVASSVARMNAMEARIEIEGDLSDLADDMAEAQAMVKAMNGEKIVLDFEIEGMEKKLKKLTKGSTEWRSLNASIMNAKKSQDRFTESILRGKSAMDAYNAQMVVRKNELRHVKAAEKAEAALAKQIEKGTESVNERAVAVARLEEKYAKLFTAEQKAARMDRGYSSRREKIILTRIRAEKDLVAEQLRAYDVTGDRLRELDVDLSHNSSLIHRWGETIAGTRIHLGFFSTTLKGLGVIFAALGPVITAVAGSIGALVGVLGAGLAGAGAVGIAGLSGFGLVLGGIVAAVKGMPAVSKAASAGWKDLSSRFAEMTKGGERSALGALNEGFKTANALLPIFAKNTTSAMRVGAAEAEKWGAMMRSDRFKGILDDVMGNFTKSIPSLSAGLRSLATGFGSIAQSASKLLPSLSGGFAKWAQNLEDSIGSGNQLDQRIQRLVGHMRQVGHFAQAGGSALATFFGIGAGPGGQFLDQMTQGLKNWNNEMKRDPSGARDFFQQSVDIMKELGPALMDMAKTAAHFAHAFAPAIETASALLNGLATGVEALIGNPIGEWAIRSAAGFWILNKALSFLAVSGLFGTGAAAAGAGAGGVGGSLMSRLFGRGGPAAAAAATGAATQAVGQFGKTATGAAAGVAATRGAMAAALGPLGLFAGAMLGVGIAANSTETVEERLNKEMAQTVPKARAAFLASEALANSRKRLTNTTQTVNQLERAGEAGTKAHTRAIRAQAQAQLDSQQRTRENNRAREENIAQMNTIRGEINKAKTAIKEYGVQEERTFGTTAGSANLAMRQEDARDYAQGLDKLRLNLLNAKREMQGMSALGPKVAGTLGQVRRMFGKQAAFKVGLTGDKAVATRTAQLSTKLGRLGQKSQVIKILANSKNAEQAFAKLQNLSAKVKDKKIQVRADNAQAIGAFTQAEHSSKKVKDKKVTITARDNASGPARAAKAAIDAVQSKTVTLTTVVKRVGGGRYEGGPIGAFAAGGQPSQMTLDRASKREEKQAAKTAAPGSLVTTPTLFSTGEIPGDKEWVITNNASFRRSNQNYLADAASALGMMVIPAYGKGKGNKKGNKKKGPSHKDEFVYDTETAGYPGANSPASARYNYWTDEIERLASVFSEARRTYDRTGSPSVSVLVGYLRAQQTGIGGLEQAIQELLSTKKGKAIPAKKMAKGKGKGQKKKREQQKTYNQNVSSFNKSRESGFESLRDELSALGFQKIGLEEDIAELTTGAQGNNVQAQAFAAATQRADAFKTYASNVGIGPFSPIGGGTSVSTPLSPPTGGYTTPSGNRSAMGGAAVGGTTVINNFAAPPADPHTWAHQQAFELAAL